MADGNKMLAAAVKCAQAAGCYVLKGEDRCEVVFAGVRFIFTEGHAEIHALTLSHEDAFGLLEELKRQGEAYKVRVGVKV